MLSSEEINKLSLRADINLIKKALPHREPFLFVDEVHLDGGKIYAERKYKHEEFFFPGHFPGNPIVPGVILVESMAQAGGVGAYLITNISNTYLFAKIRDVRFRRPVRPGESLSSIIENIKFSPSIIHQKGIGKVGDEIAVEAEWIVIVPSK